MLALVMLINRTGSMVLPFLGVYMRDHLKFDLQTAGFVLSFFGIGSVIGSWIGGQITDRIGEFKVQGLSLLLSVPLFCIMPLFTTVTGLASIILIQSIVSESFRPANSVAVQRYAKPENITRVFSLNRLAMNLGFSIGPALAGILSTISYDFLFYCNGFGALIAGITYIIFFYKRDKERPYVRPKKEEKYLANEQSPYVDFKFWIFCIACLLFSICFFQLLNTLTIFYKDIAHLSTEKIGYILGFSGILIVVLEMILVQIAEKKWSIGFTIMLGTLLCGISFAILGIDYSMITLLISITFISIGEIWALPFMSTATALRSGTHNKGAYMGMFGMSFSAAFIITPTLGTYIAKNFGFTILWFGTGILMTITAIAFYFIVPWMKKIVTS